MTETTTKRNLRAEWSENKELRRSVQDELRNWAIWSFERNNEHGYPTQQPFYTPPRDQRDKQPPPPPCNVREAEETEGFFRLWRTLAREASPDVKQHLATLMLVAKLHYLTGKTGQTKARIAGVSRPRYYRLLEEAEYRYWVIRC